MWDLLHKGMREIEVQSVEDLKMLIVVGEKQRTVASTVMNTNRCATHMHANAHTHTHMHTHAHMHTHTYTQTYIHIISLRVWLLLA